MDKADTFGYFGSLITSDAECSKEIKARVGKGQNVTAVLKRSHDVAVATKVRLMRALV